VKAKKGDCRKTFKPKNGSRGHVVLKGGEKKGRGKRYRGSTNKEKVQAISFPHINNDGQKRGKTTGKRGDIFNNQQKYRLKKETSEIPPILT